jgi:hypothetical protein
LHATAQPNERGTSRNRNAAISSIKITPFSQNVNCLCTCSVRVKTAAETAAGNHAKIAERARRFPARSDEAAGRHVFSLIRRHIYLALIVNHIIFIG